MDLLELSWNAQPGALSYNVYTSSNPCSVFQLAGNTTDTTWATEILNESGFYQVTAETAMNEKEQFIDNFKAISSACSSYYKERDMCSESIFSR